MYQPPSPVRSNGQIFFRKSHYCCVNSFCSSSSYKQEDIRHAADIVEPKDKLSSIDIKDGFYHIPVNKCDQEYLSFEFEKKYKSTV